MIPKDTIVDLKVKDEEYSSKLCEGIVVGHMEKELFPQGLVTLNMVSYYIWEEKKKHWKFEFSDLFFDEELFDLTPSHYLFVFQEDIESCLR